MLFSFQNCWEERVYLGHSLTFIQQTSIFKDISFLGVLNWVTIHSQTEKYVENISTPRDRKVKHSRVFQIALKS